jgi:hypothetical protein
MQKLPGLLIPVFILLAACNTSRKASDTNAEENHKTAVSQQIILEYRALPAPIQIDGDLSDWNTSLAYSDAATGISAMVATDTTNLYLALHVINPVLQMKILKMGMVISLNRVEPGQKIATVTFPTQTQNGDFPVQNGEPDKSRFEKSSGGIKERLIDNDIMLETRGLFFTHDGMHSAHDPAGPHASLKLDLNNNLVYEAAIPLKDIILNKALIENDQLEIGFKIRGFSQNSQYREGGDRQPGEETGGYSGQGRQRNRGGFQMNGQGEQQTGYQPDQTKDTEFSIQVSFR